MILLGQLAALGTAFCWSFTAIFFSYSGKLVGSSVVNRSRLLFAFFFVAVTHLVLQGTLFPFGTEPYRWGWLALSAILGLVLGDTFLFQAFVLIGPRLSTLMMASVPLISTLLAWIFLGERMSGLELAGILLTVAGIAWVVTERRSSESVVPEKKYVLGITFALLGAIGQATNLIAAKFALDDGYPAISASAIRILIALLILWGVAMFQGQFRYTIRQWGNRNAFKAIIGGTIVGPFLGIWLSLIAVQLAPVGLAATLMALPPIILIPIGRVLYGERVSNRGIVGTILALCGVALIFLPI
ncbi:MAG TPA: DMT family transporter [candidate division Zixibacteria bacterium]|nr:DMT family transporter [candidate division Zixibacteria bacterium]